LKILRGGGRRISKYEAELEFQEGRLIPKYTSKREYEYFLEKHIACSI